MGFEKMKDRLGVVYNCMWGDESKLCGIDIEPIFDQNKISKLNKDKAKQLLENASWKIVGSKGGEKEAIENAYDITEYNAFLPQYKRAVEGTGKENEKILTIHSSSRLSLLCFYKLYQEYYKTGNKISISLGENDEDEVEFDTAVFEFQNPVIGYPSNMDVTLINQENAFVQKRSKWKIVDGTIVIVIE